MPAQTRIIHYYVCLGAAGGKEWKVNMVIPFFGGVPATAAIARTSVAIKAGGQTRLVSIFHAIALLISMFVLGP